MIDAVPVCPTVPTPERGTVGQGGNERNTQQDSGGTSRLKRLAAAVLARDNGRDKRGTQAVIPVPHTSPLVPPVRAAVPHPPQALIGVPAAWCEGVTRLAATPCLAGVTPGRWRVFCADAAGVLRGHGAELHALGWDVLDLFGLHCRAPAVRPDCMGLAWLLNGRRVGPITPETVGIVTQSGGLLRMRRLGAQARRETVAAWSEAR